MGLFLLTALPVLAAFAAYLFWAPDKRMNYGELLTPVILPDILVKTFDGKPFRVAETRGKWLLVRVGSGQCAEECVQQLFFLRQVRLMQGREVDRVQRLWVLSDERMPDRRLVEAYSGMAVLSGTPVLLQAFGSSGDPAGSIFVVDPEGRVMLRFPPGADPLKASKDLARLLKVSHIG